MPVVAIGLAIAADAIAVSVGTTFAIIGAVGATLGAVGAITHDKTLSTIGMALGAVGGIGSLATATGLISNVSSAATTASEAAAGAVPAAVEVTPEITGTAVGGFLNPATEAVNALAAPTAAQMVQGFTSGLMNTPAAGAAAPGAAGAGDVPKPAQGSTWDSLMAMFGSGKPAGAPIEPEDVTITPDIVGNHVGSVEAAAPPTPPGSKFWDFLSTPGGGMLAGMGLQAGSSFLAGATNPLTPAQIAQAQSQAALNTAQAKVTSQQASNMGQRLPVASLAPVTGAPQVTPISGAPAQTPISGVPALTPVSGLPLGLINAPRTVGAAA